MSNSILLRVFCVVLFPIILGIGIYALTRPQGTLLSGFVYNSRIHCPAWITYNLPDAIWLFSFLSCIQIVWGKNSVEKYLWILGIAFVSIATEFLQYLHIIPGTFDVLDIFSYVLATLANLFIFRSFSNIKNNIA